jgi:hypothetical protein
LVTEDRFDVYYTMLKEFCFVEDTVIPEEYQAIEPTEAPTTPPLVEGQSVKCDANRPEVYRFTGGAVRWYPNPVIATSWDVNWPNYLVIDCTKLVHGPEMPMKLPLPSEFPEGQAIK